MTGLDQRFADAMGAALGPDFPGDIALAVSGGGDSMAMLTLAHNWAHRWGVRLWVVTVDHGLRPEAADEARMVASECALLGHPHATLRWHREGAGNLMEAARNARLSLIDRWRGGLGHVLMAHTRDDVAETFLMRLARGSGVDGLSAMAATRRIEGASDKSPLPEQDRDGALPPVGADTDAEGFTLVRPCLDMGREDLRHYLRTLKGRWVDDPSNDDPGFDRVRIRRSLRHLAEVGLTAETLSATAHRMTRAREALRLRAREAWQRMGSEGAGAGGARTGDLLFARELFEDLDRDTAMRLLAAALQYVASAIHRPRAEALESLLDRLLGGGGGTLHGCEARMERDALRIFRELKSVDQHRAVVGTPGLWDSRWRIFHPDFNGMEVRALGEDGWRQLPDRPAVAPPHHAARSLPAIWDGAALVACDALDVGPGQTATLCPMWGRVDGFDRFLLSH